MKTVICGLCLEEISKRDSYKIDMGTYNLSTCLKCKNDYEKTGTLEKKKGREINTRIL